MEPINRNLRAGTIWIHWFFLGSFIQPIVLHSVLGSVHEGSWERHTWTRPSEPMRKSRAEHMVMCRMQGRSVETQNILGCDQVVLTHQEARGELLPSRLVLRSTQWGLESLPHQRLPVSSHPELLPKTLCFSVISSTSSSEGSSRLSSTPLKNLYFLGCIIKQYFLKERRETCFITYSETHKTSLGHRHVTRVKGILGTITHEEHIKTWDV